MWMGGLVNDAGGFARRVLIAALATLAVQVSTAEASTRHCSQLEAQLVALPAAGARAPDSHTKRYDAAIGRQQQQMQKAREQARQAGCGSSMSGRAVSFCASINASMERMQQNLLDLQGKRGQPAGRDTRRERSRIQAALDANGCRGRTAPDASRQQIVVNGRNSGPVGNLRGNFRTMCVRTCDGYYFPVSNSVPQSSFDRDQKVCEAMCPGTAVELHYHRMQGEESEDMVSASSGLPYRQMSNAFLYRKQNASAPATCGCGTAGQPMQQRGFEVIGGNYSSGIVEDEPQSTAAIPQPSSRPDPAEDPETLASREGGLDAATLRRLSTPQTPARAGAEPETGQRPVRVVGPQFLPDPEAAINLQAPAPALVR